ncbi:MAG: UvrD-helicase domain-containing protein [Deltaproteobacteria bacterium]|nr:UvrD-helicase domain-containing protein [Deltaproteobacteria bacterium]
MKFIADLHIHSKYSRATARNLDFENLYYAAQIKGIRVVGTGDFTYPAWISEIESKLEEAEPGLFSLKNEIAKDIDKTIPENCRNPVRFILQTEISNIYKKEDRVRKNHNLVYFPDIKSVKKFNARLDAIGNIKSDGRPILGLDAADLLRIMLDTNDKGFFVPAHIWTPWFSMFGSKSGFDSIEQCFGSLKEHIFAVETGLSSDPPMNWRVKDLDGIRLISNSDAHSPGYLGRNASLFNTDLSFLHIRQALENNDLEKYRGTIDMYPHQGKYHYDGHRKCNICLNPATTAEIDGICPECGRKVTYGVLNRVQQLANRKEGYMPENRHGFKSIIPLADILSEIFEVGPRTKKVSTYYNKAIKALGPELPILLNKTKKEIETANVPLLAEAIMKMRAGDINIDPGFDGEFGKVNLFSRQEKERLKGEKYLLFDLPCKKAKKRTKKLIPKKALKKRKTKKDQEKKQVIKSRDILTGLNSAQQKAVDSNACAMVIQAGPGTGKTRTLTAKIACLVSKKGVDPSHILALTFTNKAAKQLEQRIDKYMPEKKGPVLAATFHSFCLKLLRDYKGFCASIADDALRLLMIRQAMVEDVKKRMVNKADHLISLCKQNLLDPDDDLKKFITSDGPDGFEKIYKNYQDLLKEQNVVDFEDLIFMTVKMLNQQENILSSVREKYRYVFIDEYQDLNLGQYELVKLICKGNNIVAIGDPDQSIYGFRGSDNKYFKLFSHDFSGCEKIILTKNYRSTQTILDASFQMISKSLEDKEKLKVFSGVENTKKLVIKETVTEKAEAVAIGKMIEKLVGGVSFFSMDTGKVNSYDQKEYSFADFAILYRTSKQCETFIRMFEKEGIPFQAADKKNMLDIDGIRQVVSLCRIIAKSENFLDFEIIFNHFGARLGKKGKSEYFKVYKESRRRGKDNLDSFIKKDTGSIKGTAGQNTVTAIAKRLKLLLDEVKACDNETCIKLVCKKAELNNILENNDKTKQAFEKLLSIARLHNDLKGFLDAVALNQDADTLEFDTQKVSLMTMHAAKGLEFPVVFIAGCEQGLVPFARDGKTIDDIEEERRLFYVAMTRAMDILCLTYAKKRSIYGTMKNRQRSFFIEDIEKKLTLVEKTLFKMPVKNKEKQLELF